MSRWLGLGKKYYKTAQKKRKIKKILQVGRVATHQIQKRKKEKKKKRSYRLDALVGFGRGRMHGQPALDRRALVHVP